MGDNDRANSIAALLYGVSGIPKIGSPGNVSVFGLGTSFCVVQTSTKQCLIGAANYGRGRVIAVGHGGYINNVKNTNDANGQKQNRIMRNCAIWAAGIESLTLTNPAQENACYPSCGNSNTCPQPPNIFSNNRVCNLPVRLGGIGLDDNQLKNIAAGLNGVNNLQTFQPAKGTKNCGDGDIQAVLNTNPNVIFWTNHNGGQEKVSTNEQQIDARVTKLISYVANGGGLVVAVCPWGWEQVSNGGKLETNCIFNHVLERMGIQFWSDFVGGDKNGVYAVSNNVNQPNLNDAEKVDTCVSKISIGETPNPGVAGEAIVGLNMMPKFAFTETSWPSPPGLPDVGGNLRNLMSRLSMIVSPYSSKLVWPVQVGAIKTIEQVACGLWVSYLNRAWRCLPPPKVPRALSLGKTPGDMTNTQRVQGHIFTLNPWLQRWQTTGVWCAAGEVATISISNEAVAAHPGLELIVRCGVHTDRLAVAKPDEKNYKLSRYPEITSQRNWNPRAGGSQLPDQTIPFHGQSPPETAPSMLIVTPFGGSLTIELIKGFNSKNPVPVSFKIDNVALTPYWNTQRETGEIQVAPNLDSYPHGRMPWAQRCAQFTTPYGELEGRYIILSMPSHTLSLINDPKAVTDFWDSVLAHELTLAGQTNSYKERIVSDVQISAGYMHSGYPVMTFLDVAEVRNGKTPALIDLATLQRDGNWGVYHELGHNRQRGEWTFWGAGEVTVNIFSLYIMKVINNLNPFQTKFMKDQTNHIKSYVTDPKKNFDNAWITDAGTGLGVYATFIHQYGFQVIADIFREYNAMKNKPNSDVDKRTEWVKKTSLHTKTDLRPYYDQWKWPYNKNIRELDGLPKYNQNIMDVMNQALSGH